MPPTIRIIRARGLRERSTNAERLLWSQIRDRKVHGVKFRRQEPIGHFIVDYLAVKERLIVELDGGQHAQSTAMDRDAQRTRYLEHMGYRVLRFWNNEVLQNTAGVLEAIGDAIKEQRDQPFERRGKKARPSLSPRSGRGSG